MYYMNLQYTLMHVTVLYIASRGEYGMSQRYLAAKRVPMVPQYRPIGNMYANVQDLCTQHYYVHEPYVSYLNGYSHNLHSGFIGEVAMFARLSSMGDPNAADCVCWAVLGSLFSVSNLYLYSLWPASRNLE